MLIFPFVLIIKATLERDDHNNLKAIKYNMENATAKLLFLIAKLMSNSESHKYRYYANIVTQKSFSNKNHTFLLN